MELGHGAPDDLVNEIRRSVGVEDEVAQHFRLQSVRLMQYGIATDAADFVAQNGHRAGEGTTQFLGDIA